jgi:hypothetical protein
LNLRCIFAPMVLFLALSAFEQAGAFEISTNNVSVLGREIKVYFYKPAGAGPFPLLILSHGSPRKAQDRIHFWRAVSSDAGQGLRRQRRGGGGADPARLWRKRQMG